MDAPVVRQRVRQFWEKMAHTDAEPHCFAPWYLHLKFQLSETQAIQQSSDGSYDFGVDAFYLMKEGDGKPSTLVLVQAKYTDNLHQISRGFRDLERALPEVARSITAVGTEELVQNKVLVNLRAALNRLDPDTRSRLVLDFQLLHISELDGEILNTRLQEATTRLQNAVREILGEEHTCVITLVGPRDLGPQQFVVARSEDVALRIDGNHEFRADETARMFSGFGRLAELVDLYNKRRDDLFSRNVRYYLRSKKNTERGPAGKMRKTLKQICVEGSSEPERFALFRNGITIFSNRAQFLDGQIHLRDPYVLNGCQTIKNAFFFRFDPTLKSKIKDDCWQRVAVPIRIIETADDELVRSVTVNNNRQNAMRPAALRSNDPVQIRLQQRFKERHVFYQRQEGAFDEIRLAQKQVLQDEYGNTRDWRVDIEDVARSIAASAGHINDALRPNDLFETDAAYDRCFEENKRLRSIVFLTFLQNLHDVVGLVLKKNLELTPKNGGPKSSRFVFHTICLLVRYLAQQGMYDFVAKWGDHLHRHRENVHET